MDPELAAIARMTPRLDFDDVQQVRIDDREIWDGQLPAGALDRWSPLVDWQDEPLELADGRTVTCRVYRPHAAEPLSPGIVFIHGGAFVIGNIEQEHPRCMRYAAELRTIVVSLEYRLAPECPYPCGFDDCYQGTAAVFARAAEMGIDKRRIAVGGVSAGGSLAAAVALKARDESAFGIAYQFLLCPVLDDRMTTQSMREYADSPGWDARQARQMWDYYLGPDRDEVSPFAAPARASDLSGLPPTYLLVAEVDPLRDEALDYGARLIRAGVGTEIHHFPGTFHSFDGLIGPEYSERAMAEQVATLRFALRP